MKFFDRKVFTHFDWPLFFCSTLILCLGLVNLYSATYNLPEQGYFARQSIFILVGIFVMLLVLIPDYRLLERFAYPIYVLGVLQLVAIFFFGKVSQGAQRWLSFGPLLYQPSETMKLVIVIILAKHFHHRRATGVLFLKELFWPGVLTAIPFVLILRQPDLGTALVVLAIAISMILFVGISRKMLALFLLFACIGPPLAWKFVLHDYQKDRIYAFLEPEKYSAGKGYQVTQSKIAIGSGKLTGKGFLEGSQSKLKFLPKQHTDFVFSNYAEEFGFLGSIFVLGLYASFSLLGLNVGYTAKDKFGMMLAIGMTSIVFTQALINLGMESGLLPVVGVTLPLFSYGGSSSLTTLLAIGLLLNVSMRRYMF